MIELRGVTKRQGGREVATELSLQVRPGEAVAIAGPSGSGKTTLLRLIAGLDWPDRGEIRLADRPVTTDDAPHTRGIGFLFQHSALWPHMTVADNIGFGLGGIPRTGREERIRELLEAVDLAGFAMRAPATLSGGEARRVALARALAPQKPILLLDEPLTNLDPETRERVVGLIAREHQVHKMTIVLATHDHIDGARLCRRSFVLANGQLTPMDSS